MTRLWTFIRAAFAWRDVRDSGVWIYSENAVTGQRKAWRYCACGQPLNFDFMRPGDIVVDHGGWFIL